jgi:hypothetical protein
MSSSKAAAAAGGSSSSNNSTMQTAKRQELSSWCAKEVEEATALQRAKRALKDQMQLRATAAARLRALTDTTDTTAGTTDTAEASSGSEEQALVAAAMAAAAAANSDSDAPHSATTTAAALLREQVEERSRVIKSLQAYVLAAERDEKFGGTGTGEAKWSRLKTPWEMKVSSKLFTVLLVYMSMFIRCASILSSERSCSASGGHSASVV